jgi:hypothetical protein
MLHCYAINDGSSVKCGLGGDCMEPLTIVSWSDIVPVPGDVEHEMPPN